MMAVKPSMKKTKVDVPAPPPRTNRMQFLAKLPEVAEAPPPANLSLPSSDRALDLNFKVSEEFHRAFKAAAVMRGMSMKALLEEAFRLWLNQNGEMRHVAKDVAAGVTQERAKAIREREKTQERPKTRTRRDRHPDLWRGD